MPRTAWIWFFALGLSFYGCDCSDDDPPMGDAGPTDAGPRPDVVRPGECGNGILEDGEACDDLNTDPNDGCAADCTLECGDGAVTGDELCDTAIAAGMEGACPSDCDDGDACTTDALDGADCSLECSHAPITAAAEGDGCCPDGVDATMDGDCPSTCGNAVLEIGEACDTGIADGTAGACPTACDDSMDCTTDTLANGGTCDAMCEYTAITTAADGDLCCPAGETIATDSDCAVMCGDGVVSTGETCDTAIASGTGSCPTACDDGVACTTDALTNGGTCTATCTTTTITTPVDGDGCCPAGATMATDSDCTGTCGDGVVSGGESCDTAIAAGSTGACPTSCNDGMVCTTDTLSGAGTCSATCSYSPITAPTNGDGCCPTGATIATDNDCPAVCGDGVVTASAMETCDTGIATGTGSCPSSCNDGMACTMDVLANPGTCRATCSFPPVTMAVNGDGCCPGGATIATDNDCPARCGDGIVTAPETCDDGNTTSGDGCSATCTAEPIAFRFTDMDLMDPHVFADAFGCRDVTNFDLFGIQGVNPTLQDNIQTDGDSDGLLDLSLAHVFAPLVQSAGTSTPSYLVFPDCTAPMSSTMCTLPAGATRVMGTAMNMGSGATCLDILTGTVRPYSPAVIRPTAPAGGTCYVASAGTVSFDLGGIMITLQDASIAGEWFGTPATEIRDGLIRGFLSEADANAAIVPEGTTGLDSIDGEPVSSLLRGGTGNCSAPAPMVGDTDTYMGMRGWYFYLNFRATRVPYTEM